MGTVMDDDDENVDQNLVDRIIGISRPRPSDLLICDPDVYGVVRMDVGEVVWFNVGSVVMTMVNRLLEGD
jgi:hypothetical protein